MHVEVIGEVEDGEVDLQDRSLRFSYRLRDAHTRNHEMQELRRAIASW